MFHNYFLCFGIFQESQYKALDHSSVYIKMSQFINKLFSCLCDMPSMIPISAFYFYPSKAFYLYFCSLCKTCCTEMTLNSTMLLLSGDFALQQRLKFKTNNTRYLLNVDSSILLEISIKNCLTATNRDNGLNKRSFHPQIHLAV